MLENTEGAIKNWQSRETDNIVHEKQDDEKQNKNTKQYTINDFGWC